MRPSARGLAHLALCLQLSACSGNRHRSTESTGNGGAAGAAGAPSAGPPDTLFAADVVNDIEEGNYFLTGSADGDLDVTLLLRFFDAMHVELGLEGGAIDDVTGFPADDESATLRFDFPSAVRSEYDFSAGTYQVDLFAHDVDGAYRLDLHATPLGGTQL